MTAAAPTSRQCLGAAGEAAALKRLEAAGLKPVARNYHSRHGEIDLIMLDGATLVFVEVRARSNPLGGGALASVGVTKQGRLLRAAAEFLASFPAHAQRTCRFDVVGYEGHGSAARCEWVRQAFEAH
ncbi:MAG: YraN family protein [Metallibacterium sp.]